MTGNRRDEPAHPGQFLVLAHPGDTGALTVAATLEERHGTGRVDLVSEIALADANWVHHQGDAGTTSRVDLGDGRTITHDGYAAVFNRLRAVYPRRFAAADEADRQYAQAELNALVLAWLAAFACPVVPGPAPPTPSPELPSLPGLLVDAGRAGFPTRRFAFASNARQAPAMAPGLAFDGQAPPTATGLAADPVPSFHLGREPALYLEPVAGTPREVLVVGDDVLGPVPEGLASACVRFARESGYALLRLTFDRRTEDGSGDWCLCGADAHPAIDTWEEAVAVARYLEDVAVAGEAGDRECDAGDERKDADGGGTDGSHGWSGA